MKEGMITTHVHPDGTVIASVKLADGRVLRIAGQRAKGDEAARWRYAREPYDELYKTLFLLGWRLDKQE